MHTTLTAILSVVLLFAVVALVREVRLRRAFQTLLNRLLNYWRSREQAQNPSDDADPDAVAAGGGRDNRRLQ